jgi:hypothetical protein
LNFDLMIVLVANKLIMRLKLPNNAFIEFRSHEKCRDQEIESIIRNFDLIKSAKKFDLMNSISWKIEFRSHEIRPPDPESWWHSCSWKCRIVHEYPIVHTGCSSIELKNVFSKFPLFGVILITQWQLTALF